MVSKHVSPGTRKPSLQIGSMFFSAVPWKARTGKENFSPNDFLRSSWDDLQTRKTKERERERERERKRWGQREILNGYLMVKTKHKNGTTFSIQRRMESEASRTGQRKTSPEWTQNWNPQLTGRCYTDEPMKQAWEQVVDLTFSSAQTQCQHTSHVIWEKRTSNSWTHCRHHFVPRLFWRLRQWSIHHVSWRFQLRIPVRSLSYPCSKFHFLIFYSTVLQTFDVLPIIIDPTAHYARGVGTDCSRTDNYTSKNTVL